MTAERIAAMPDAELYAEHRRLVELMFTGVSVGADLEAVRAELDRREMVRVGPALDAYEAEASKRLALYADPAFLCCLYQAAAMPEMLANHDRLYGTTLVSRATPIERMVDEATGKLDDDLRSFAEFVREYVYERLDPKTLDEIRKQAAEFLEKEE